LVVFLPRGMYFEVEGQYCVIFSSNSVIYKYEKNPIKIEKNVHKLFHCFFHCHKILCLTPSSQEPVRLWLLLIVETVTLSFSLSLCHRFQVLLTKMTSIFVLHEDGGPFLAPRFTWLRPKSHLKQLTTSLKCSETLF
jgi:hypothetical protein